MKLSTLVRQHAIGASIVIGSIALAPYGVSAQASAYAARQGNDPVAVVRRYYAAIDARDYRTAWVQWSADGQPGQNFAAFRRGFADTQRVRLTVTGRAQIEGAAGSAYATIPVRVDTVLRNGRRQHYSGSYVLRRVNGIDGATPAQARWHITSATLRGR